MLLSSQNARQKDLSILISTVYYCCVYSVIFIVVLSIYIYTCIHVYIIMNMNGHSISIHTCHTRTHMYNIYIIHFKLIHTLYMYMYVYLYIYILYILETYVEYRHAFLLLISFSHTYSQLISYTIAVEYRSIDGQIDI